MYTDSYIHPHPVINGRRQVLEERDQVVLKTQVKQQLLPVDSITDIFVRKKEFQLGPEDELYPNKSVLRLR